MEVSVKLGVLQQKMRNTTINELGTYQSQLHVGDTQSLTFNYGDHGPFYLSPDEREGLMFDVFSGAKKILKKNKKMLVAEIRKTGFQIKGHLSKDELERIANGKKYRTYLRVWCKERRLDGQAKGLAPDPMGARFY